MSEQAGKSPLKRKSTHYFNAILITALCLFLLGIMCVLSISFNYEEARIKERIKISAFLKDDANEADAKLLQKKIEADEAVKSTEYISKADAAQIVKEKYNEDITEMLGDYNPLPASIEVYLNAAMVNVDSIEAYQKHLQAYSEIKFTKVDEQLIGSIDSNFRIVSLIVAVLSILFLLIAIAIIDKTIRLSMYSNRFIIRSMQLVGATRSFVTAPYVRKSFVNGLISSLVAVALVGVLILIVQHNYHYWDFTSQLRLKFAGAAGLIIAIGIFITWWSTRNSVHKYIQLKLDELY